MKIALISMSRVAREACRFTLLALGSRDLAARITGEE
jgi:hypothetical protein